MIPHIDTQLYDYELPEWNNSKLLTYKHGTIGQTTFNKLLDHLPANATLVFNNTKVIRARLKLQKDTGAQIEIFCLEPIEPIDIQQSFATTSCVKWKCIIGNSKKWKEGSLRKTLTNGTISTTLSATRISIVDNTSIVEFSWDNRLLTFADIIDLVGVTPIPPYLNRETEDIDTERYQTVYSEHKGSVAAPTAGLHFSDEIMQELRSHGHQLINVTLHVGAGTFKPVSVEEITDHKMHSEDFIFAENAADSLNRTVKNGGRIFAVGTTSLRVLESCVTEERTFLPRSGSTDIFIYPPYQVRSADCLLTNFHLPQSTLLMLVSAFAGYENIMKAYQLAIRERMRFFSYGDCMLILR